jgi:hypothetical protein
MSEKLEDVPVLTEMPADKPVSEEPVQSEVRFRSLRGLEPRYTEKIKKKDLYFFSQLTSCCF